jgi:hypothetical protein
MIRVTPAAISMIPHDFVPGELKEQRIILLAI